MESKVKVRFFFVAHLGRLVLYGEAVATPISKKFSVTLDEHLDEFEDFDSWYQKMHLKISQKIISKIFVCSKKNIPGGIFSWIRLCQSDP